MNELIEPLGFTLDDAALRRAGLDYHEFVDLSVYETLKQCLDAIGSAGPAWAFSRGGSVRYDTVHYGSDAVLVFGTEASGLDDTSLALFGENVASLPMRPHNRSLNLSNAVAIVAYEAWKQGGFEGSADLQSRTSSGDERQ